MLDFITTEYISKHIFKVVKPVIDSYMAYIIEEFIEGLPRNIVLVVISFFLCSFFVLTGDSKRKAKKKVGFMRELIDCFSFLINSLKK